VLILAAVVLLAAGFAVSPGLFTIDEALYSAASQTFLANGHFGIENGWPEFSSDDLRLSLLVEGRRGLVSQYPGGHSIVGAQLLRIFGERGLMLGNVFAGIAMMFALRALAVRLFGDTTAALVAIGLLLAATFWLEYVFAVWPHAISALCVTLALICTLDCLDAETGFGRKAIMAGAVIGFGMLMRVDTILAIPAIGLIVWLFARRPVRVLALLGLGFVPFIALASAVNFAKLGTLNPLSYGQDGPTATNLSAHMVPIAILALGAIFAFASRLVTWRPSRRGYGLALAAGIAVVIVSATARHIAETYLSGAWVLVGDITAIADRRQGIEEMPGGLLLFWGHFKKALGQSMPWLGLLLLAVHQPADKHARRSQIVILIFAAVWSLPFFMVSWHGGLASNMRYLLPLVPFLCAWVAKLMLDLSQTVPRARTSLAIGAAIGFWLLITWNAFHPTGIGGVQQVLSTYLLLAITSLAMLSGIRWSWQHQTRLACLVAAGAGLAAAAFFSFTDFMTAQSDRATNRRYSEALSTLPDRALVYAPPRFVTDWSFRPGHLTALPKSAGGDYDYEFIDHALDKGYRVFVWRGIASDGLRRRYGARLRESKFQFVGMVEVTPNAPLKSRQARCCP